MKNFWKGSKMLRKEKMFPIIVLHFSLFLLLLNDKEYSGMFTHQTELIREETLIGLLCLSGACNLY